MFEQHNIGPDNKIKCDCCGTETLAEIKGNKLVIIAKRHGRRHLVVLTLGELLKLLRLSEEPRLNTHSKP